MVQVTNVELIEIMKNAFGREFQELPDLRTHGAFWTPLYRGYLQTPVLEGPGTNTLKTPLGLSAGSHVHADPFVSEGGRPSLPQCADRHIGCGHCPEPPGQPSPTTRRLEFI